MKPIPDASKLGIGYPIPDTLTEKSRKYPYLIPDTDTNPCIQHFDIPVALLRSFFKIENFQLIFVKVCKID